MKSIFTVAIIIGFICNGISSAQTAKEDAADEAALKADHIFLQALRSADKTTAADLLDDEFTWTDSTGKTLTKAEVLPSLGSSVPNSYDTNVRERTYEDVAVITSSHERVHVVRIWVKRKAGWRMLVYHEATLVEQAGALVSSGVTSCENPCKSLPYIPKNDAEKGIITSWQGLETAVTNHDSTAWAQHVADEFVLVNSNNDHPFTKSDRVAILDKQKQAGSGAAPVPLVSANMFDFGDTVVMTARHQRGTSKPIHVTRVWIKRDGQWLMAFSQQTIVQ